MKINKQTDLSTFNNYWYNVGAPPVKVIIWYFVNILFFINPFNPFVRIKIMLLRLFGATVGKRIIIKPRVSIKYPWLLEIGDNTWIGEKVWIDNLAQIKIGNNVCISQGAFLLTGNHNYTKPTFDLMANPIVLEDGVWIGAKSIVCPNVTCKSHAILAVNSIATQDLEPYIIYQGNPAQKVRERNII